MLVSEPEDASASVSLIVERIGGATGVVEVSWSLTSSNGESNSSATDYHETSMVFPLGIILFNSRTSIFMNYLSFLPTASYFITLYRG